MFGREFSIGGSCGKKYELRAAAGHPPQRHAQDVPAGARIARDARGGRARKRIRPAGYERARGYAAQRATARRARLRNGIWQADARRKPSGAVRRQKSEPRGGGRPSGTKTCAGCPCGRAHCAGCTRRPGQKTHPACRTRKGARVRGAACDCQTRSASQWDMGGRRAGRARPARRAAAMYDWEGRYQ